jgi:hypothetical protein
MMATGLSENLACNVMEEAAGSSETLVYSSNLKMEAGTFFYPENIGSMFL